MAWKEAWTDKRFRLITIIGSVLLFVILASFPFFFTYIETRPGTQLHDRLLLLLPPRDVSVPTFVIIWSMTALLWIRCVQDPSVFIVFLCSFILLSVTRMITIMLVPLDPPQGLIPLKDPLSSIFYGGMDVFIQKDLFYSGHTSIQLLMFFTFKKKSDKFLAFFSSLAIASFVLLQHVHYTIDVLGALLFSFFVHRASKKITGY
ncbi:phosphatase PAP2-related protein [Sediminibacterium soli]|uniref:phosphatase PAP2-related protein n=1 Tax=Sediminibacterium soli TaxID=2698829 RepID=UPI00137B70F6|nr:phosphatase PAP2-related protein [Sediminibacterium soli]NCI46403.1 hypothetical protein [Sediminibacterium soli]